MSGIDGDLFSECPFNYEYGGLAWALMNNIHVKKEIMDGIFKLVEDFFCKTTKLMAIRLELKMNLATENNLPMSQFCKKLKQKLICHYGPIYHGYIWVREKAGVRAQHYHMALLLDGQKVKYHSNIYRIAKKIWMHGYLSLPNNPFYHVHCDCLESLRLLMYRLSYLAKSETKGNRLPAVKDYQISRSVRNC